MKIKYFTFSNINWEGGVGRKLIHQAIGLRKLGIDVEIVSIAIGNNHQDPPYDFITLHAVGDSPPGNRIERIKRARYISGIFRDIIDSLDPMDILYYRYSGSIPIFYPKNFIKKFRRCIIVAEHQTKEIDEYRLDHNHLSSWSDLLFGRYIRTQYDAIVGVTDEIVQYEVGRTGERNMPMLSLGNGVNVQSIPIRRNPCCGDTIHILCVANVSRWHGLDRLLMGMANYNRPRRVVLHIAGEGKELPNLKRLVNDNNLSDQVIFHGFISGKQLDMLFDICHIAVGSLGIHRKGLAQTSELKGREYCARGIPFFLATSDPDFPPDFPYVLQFAADESPIDVQRVVEFANMMRVDSEHPQKMRRFAEENLDMSVKMKELKVFLERLLNDG